MSIFTNPPSELGTADLQELLDNGAVENARLEFKLEAPNKDETLKIVAQLKNSSKNDSGAPLDIAAIYAALGQKDDAFKWLQTALEKHPFGMAFFKCVPEFDSLRSDSRYTDLLRRMGLPQ